jgi:hypothetical protein
MPRTPPPRTDRDALIAALAEEARRAAPESPDPEPEELLGYLDGRLAPEDEERLGRRLAASPEAARALLDLAELEEATRQAGTGPADLAARAGWHDLQSRLPESAPRSRHPPAWLSAIAAALLIATIGLSVWNVRLQGRLRQPVANVVSLELISEGRGTEPVATVPPGAPLLLRLSPAERCPSYAAEVSGPGDHRSLVEGLLRDTRGNLTLLEIAGEPGQYDLRLLGCEPRREVEEHSFRIEAHDE